MNAIASQPVLLGSLAVLSLLPAALQSLRAPLASQADNRFWYLLGCAFGGSALLSVSELAQGWQPGLAVALWVTITTVLAIFAGIAWRNPAVKPIGNILFPYLVIVGAFGALALPGDPPSATYAADWGTVIHVLLSVAAYALITLSAVAAVSSLLKERALKARSQSVFVNSLPPVTVGDRMQINLLLAAGCFLSFSVISGIAEQWDMGIRFDHKSLLSVVSLGIVTALLFVHFRTGLRGRRAARFALGAYLLLSLAYPGVKFVTDILLQRV
ncbi:MAG: cytochrome c biogenesis protein CcsA [Alphaproteobacteria bacterium]|nr:cytochrome c biogenesis protein CcsA [Alphaproteobacteria bacterium]